MGAIQSTNRCEIFYALASQRLREPVNVRHDVHSEFHVGLRFLQRVPRVADEIAHDLAFEFDATRPTDFGGSSRLARIWCRGPGG